MKNLRIPLIKASATILLIITLSILFTLTAESPTFAAKKQKSLAKNIIIMISDGWGFNHLEAASYWAYGKDARQIYNRFPFNFAMSTYMAYKQGDPCYDHGYNPELAWSDFNYVRYCATDSAAAATALSTGMKTYKGAL